MSQNNDLWEHLEISGIKPCCEDSEVEIDNHEMRSVIDISRSYYFDCIEFNAGIQFSTVFVRITTEGEIHVDPNEIIFDITPGMDTQARVNELIEQLREGLRTFIQNRGDLV